MIPPSIRRQDLETLMGPLLGSSVKVVRLSAPANTDAVDDAVSRALAVVDGLPEPLRHSGRRALRKALDEAIFKVRRPDRETAKDAAEALFKTERAA